MLTLVYTFLMFAVFSLILILSHEGIEWAVTSEQAHELAEVAVDLADTEVMLLNNGIYVDEDLGKRDRLFFYVFDNNGQLRNFSKAPMLLEDDIMDIIQSGQVPMEDVALFEKHEQGSRSREAVIMMSAAPMLSGPRNVGTVYVGKDVTALYKGIKKSTYCIGGIAFVALLAAACLGHSIAGRIIQPMQEAYEKQRQFAADASHELRTPLAVVMASADLLDSDPSIQSPICKQVIVDLKDEVKKMSKLVSDLLTVARSDGNGEKINIATFDIGESLKQILRNMQPLAGEKSIELIGVIPDGINYTGDQQKISQLALILVDNAVKYTPEGGTVTVTLENWQNDRLCFSVADTGMGIAPENQSKVFERFYRVDKARSREMGGNGLGLSIAQTIVRAHSGSISLESELNKGTTFYVELKNLSGKET